MGDVMAADGIHQRNVPHDAVILHMAAEVEQLVVQVQRGVGDQQQPAGIGRPSQFRAPRAGGSDSVMNATSA